MREWWVQEKKNLYLDLIFINDWEDAEVKRKTWI